MTQVTDHGSGPAQNQAMTTAAIDWTQAPVEDLVSHIVGEHHEYLRRAMPRITSLLAEAWTRESAPPAAPLAALESLWQPFVDEMNGHLWKEEMILFPAVRAMACGAGEATSHCGGVQNPIRVMLMEHDSADSALRAMRRVTGGFTLPAGCGESVAALYRALEELESDVYAHIRKENEILFPRALGMQE